MLHYCFKFRKNMGNKNPKVAKTNKRKLMVLSVCAVSDSKKSRFIKERGDSGLLTSSRLKTPLKNVQYKVLFHFKNIKLITY